MKKLIVFLILCMLTLPLGAESIRARSTKTYSVPSGYQTLIDYDSGTNPIYIGTADAGVATSTAVWYIIKISWDANDNPTAVKFRDLVVWDDRASITF